MKYRQAAAGLFLFASLFLQISCQGLNAIFPAVITVGVPTLIPSGTATLEMTKTPEPSIIDGFEGMWINYSTISLNTGLAINRYNGVHLEIMADRFVVDDNACTNPNYEVNQISLKEFLGNYKKPANVVELNEKEFPFLSMDCAKSKVTSLGLVNRRTLGAVIGSDLLFFEEDLGVTRNGMTIASSMMVENSSNPMFEIHAQVPYLKEPESIAFDTLARSMILKETEGFRQNFDDWDIPEEMASYKSFMWIGYDVPLLTEDLVSIRFLADYYMAGAAHPNHYYKVLNYDLKANREITFEDVFPDPEKTLIFLADACRTSLNKPDFTLFEEGLQPKMENFTNWNLTPDGLRISFDPYMVAPYAAGPQEVLIPYSDIKDQVNANTTVGAFIAH